MRFFATLLALSILGSAFAAEPLAVPREFRAAWVATVANIDWPSKKGLPAAEQKAELVAIFDKCKAMKLNAVVLQVRPMADALYESKLEPWSEYLTGEQGKHPGYDPLTFAVDEAHKRGLELHAWFNPYRAWSPTAKSDPHPLHFVAARPDLAKKYGKHHWLNPTHPEVRKHSLAVILDAVHRYDLDGIHMDDYFYPYPEQDENKLEIPFPDDDTWEAYQKTGGRLGRDDWRRDAVNAFVRELYIATKKAKPWVKVGISPFGIGRPGTPPGIVGFDQYAKIYADAGLWLREGWVDYFTPQLYWPIDQEKQSFPKLLDWWRGENPKARHVWPGLYTSKHSPKEIAAQVKLTRQNDPSPGHVHFSMKALMKDRDGITGELKPLYQSEALVPAMPWLGDKKQDVPAFEKVEAGRVSDTWIYKQPEMPVWLYAVSKQTELGWTTEVKRPDAGVFSFDVPRSEKPIEVRVLAISRTGVASEVAKGRP